MVVAAIEIPSEVVLDGLELLQPMKVFRRLLLTTRLQVIQQRLVAELVILQEGEVELVVPLRDFIRQLKCKSDR